MVQDRNMVAMEVQYELVYDLMNGTTANALQCPWMTLKLTLLFETFLTPIPRETRYRKYYTQGIMHDDIHQWGCVHYWKRESEREREKVCVRRAVPLR